MLVEQKIVKTVEEFKILGLMTVEWDQYYFEVDFVVMVEDFVFEVKKPESQLGHFFVKVQE